MAHGVGAPGFAIHPGEMLEKEFLEPMEVTAYRLAKSIGVPQITISEIIRGKRGISADMALRLAKFFGTTEEMWMNMQSQYELAIARKKSKAAVAKIRPYQAA